MKEKKTDWTEQEAFDQALRFLSLRSLSTKELRGKMVQKGIGTEIFEAVAEKLRAYEYLNDDRLRQELTEAYCRRQKFSRRYIEQKMFERGLSPSAMLTSYDEGAVALRLVDKKFFPAVYGDMDSQYSIKASRKKVQSFLYNRGFSSTTISYVCGEFSDCLE